VEFLEGTFGLRVWSIELVHAGLAQYNLPPMQDSILMQGKKRFNVGVFQKYPLISQSFLLKVINRQDFETPQDS